MKFLKHQTNKKSNLHCTHVSNESARFSAWVTQLQKTALRCRAVGDTVSDVADPGFEPQTSRTDNNVLTTELTGRFFWTTLDVRISNTNNSVHVEYHCIFAFSFRLVVYLSSYHEKAITGFFRARLGDAGHLSNFANDTTSKLSGLFSTLSF